LFYAVGCLKKRSRITGRLVQASLNFLTGVHHGTGRKTYPLLVGPGFEDLEFWVPLMRLQEAGADVVVAGIASGETYHGKSGLSATADIGFDDVDSSEFDGLVIPGGWAPDRIRRYDSVKRFVADFFLEGKPIGIICHGGLVAISAGIVNGLECTGSEAYVMILKMLEQSGKTFLL
jgi:protease I